VADGVDLLQGVAGFSTLPKAIYNVSGFTTTYGEIARARAPLPGQGLRRELHPLRRRKRRDNEGG
jgi:hypothetical protein